MSHRTYNFPLPVKLSSFQVSMAPYMLQSHGLWNSLPKALQDKIDRGAAHHSGIDLTKEDLDSIDDSTWVKLESFLGYAHNAPAPVSDQQAGG